MVRRKPEAYLIPNLGLPVRDEWSEVQALSLIEP